MEIKMKKEIMRLRLESTSFGLIGNAGLICLYLYIISGKINFQNGCNRSSSDFNLPK